MTKNNLVTKNNIQKKYYKKNFNSRHKNFKKIFSEVLKDINNPKKTLSTLNQNFKINFSFKSLKKFKKFQTIAIIGMGGSILSAQAIENFIQKKINKKIYYFDSLDIEKNEEFKKKENKKKVLFLVISKSGNTIETVSNLFSLKILKKNLNNIIIISEKKNNLLYNLSKKLNLFYIEHRDYIGGRYSVLSEVGIVPAYLMGIDIKKLRKNIHLFYKSKKRNYLQESSLKLANLIKARKISNLVFLNYSPRLDKFLFWAQQLIAESLGKSGRGFFPVISPAPKDHHSLLQLYLDGPKDKIFHIFSVDENSKEKIHTKTILSKNYLDQKKLSRIKDAQKNALIKVLRKKDIPFREFKISSLSEQSLGELFSYFILETVIIGKLLKVNPFDQPAVEQVKILTKKIIK